MLDTKKLTMNMEQLRSLDSYSLAEQMPPFRHDYKNSMSSEDNPEEEWSCLISLVEGGEVKFDDLSEYGFNYFDAAKMKEEEIKEIDVHLKKAIELAKKTGISSEVLIEKLKSF